MAWIVTVWCFSVNSNCDIAVETRPAKNGAIVRNGKTDDTDGVARRLGDVGAERFVYSSADGCWRTVEIGALIVKESILGHLNGLLVRAPFDGILRGIVRDGTDVPAGVKLLEVDPRGPDAQWTGWMNAGERSPRPRSTPSVFTPRKRKVQAFRRAADLRNCLYDRPPNLGFHDSWKPI